MSTIGMIARPSAAQQLQPNPLQRALNDYHLMEADLAAANRRASEADALSASLMAETNMLREALERADSDRIRLQAVASTLLGRLLAINDCIGGAVRASIKDGIEAVSEAKAEDELEAAGAEVQAILQSLPRQPALEAPPARTPAPAAPQAVGGASIPAVDWRRLPQG